MIPASIQKRIKKENGHWHWVGAKTVDGYPQASLGAGDTFKVMSYLYKLLRGPVPAGRRLRPIKRSDVCNAKVCVRPSHYELAPVRRKIQMPGVGKGRNPNGRPKPMLGEKNPKHKLTETQVKEIRELAARMSAREVKRRAKLPVSETQILRIKNRKNWRHL